MVAKEGIHVNPEKVKAVWDWLVPQSVRELRAFLCLMGFYCQFIQDYAAKARPLYDATNVPKAGGQLKLVWDQAKQKAYDASKEALTTALVLTASEAGDGEFDLYCNA